MHLWAADGDLELYPGVICVGWKEKDLGLIRVNSSGTGRSSSGDATHGRSGRYANL